MLKINLIGNLGADAEVRHLDNGQSVISFSLAHSERWTDKNGQKQEKTEWIRCSIWRQSDKTSIVQYLKKGVKLYVEGKPLAKSYNNQNGEVVSYLEINVNNFEFLSAVEQQPTGAAQPTQNVAQPTPSVAQPTANMAHPSNVVQQPINVAVGMDDDDLPF
jgi:single-strand DNA-binding protein